MNAKQKEALKTASGILNMYHDDFDEYENDNTIKNAVKLSAEILLSTECGCDFYNGYDCGCRNRIFIANEALRGI